jgi:hypothetical protein
MSIAFPLVEGLKNDTICKETEIDNYIQLHKRPFREAVQGALHSEVENMIESRWTEADIIDSSVVHAQNAGQVKDKRKIQTAISPDQIFKTVQRIGGRNGWYYANWAWRIRGGFDRLIGGVGMRRGRRHPIDIRVGDAIDFWRVTEFEPGRRLRLQAEMKLPGVAWLEYVVEPTDDGGSRFIQTAVFQPFNWFGYLYWYLLSPAHYFIFRNMALNVIRVSAQQPADNDL